MNFSGQMRRHLAGWLPSGAHECVMCGHKVSGFLPFRGGSRTRPALSRALACVGSDVDHFACPRCGAHDRERHLFLYMRAAGLLSEMSSRTIVHFAPEKHLSARIAAATPERYVRCDLLPASPDIQRVDLLSMPFESGSVDLLIASHVLEHVADDMRALSEIRRVLRVGGHAILQTPYSPVLHHTWEDEGITDAAARLQAFGQEDHVRLYGRDIFERIGSAGLEPRVATHAELLPQVDPRKFGVNALEPFFLFRRAK